MQTAFRYQQSCLHSAIADIQANEMRVEILDGPFKSSLHSGSSCTDGVRGSIQPSLIGTINYQLRNA
jgi:hypothetical protein